MRPIFHGRPCNHQNVSFNANWIWRENVAVLLMEPADELMLFVEQTGPAPAEQVLPEKIISFGYAKLAWLKRLKTSARNCRLSLSLMGIFLNSEVSKLAKP